MISTALAATTRHTTVESPLGALTLVADGSGVAGLYYPGHWTRPDPKTFGRPVELAPDATLEDAAAQLKDYFNGGRRSFDLPISPAADEIQHALRVILQSVPYGQTTTYGAVANDLGGGVSPRDVGALVGRNPLSILVPCHRVVGAGGKLTGYAGGLKRKRLLLDLEQSVLNPAATLW
jgi:methylated-DNA-[protein]-cysteine S-methyltransferase